MRRRPSPSTLIFAVMLVLVVGIDLSAQEPGPNFRPIVMMVGCVEDDGRGGFILTDATAPVELEDRLPEEPAEDAALGTERARLIGTLEEFGVANHVGHKVRVRGLHIEGESEDRLNVTSILHVSPACR